MNKSDLYSTKTFQDTKQLHCSTQLCRTYLLYIRLIRHTLAGDSPFNARIARSMHQLALDNSAESLCRQLLVWTQKHHSRVLSMSRWCKSQEQVNKFEDGILYRILKSIREYMEYYMELRLRCNLLRILWFGEENLHHLTTVLAMCPGLHVPSDCKPTFTWGVPRSREAAAKLSQTGCILLHTYYS